MAVVYGVLSPLYIELRCPRVALHWLKVSYISERTQQDGDSLTYVNHTRVYVIEEYNSLSPATFNCLVPLGVEGPIRLVCGGTWMGAVL